MCIDETLETIEILIEITKHIHKVFGGMGQGMRTQGLVPVHIWPECHGVCPPSLGLSLPPPTCAWALFSLIKG